MKKISFNFNTISYIIILITIICYGLLINNINLWSDEIYSVLMAKDNFSDMWNLLTTEDSKPPLYYFYLKFVLTFFPHSLEIWAAHFSSFILLIATQIFAFIVIRKDFGKSVAIWFIILCLLMPQSLWLAFEVRTYMLSNFLMLVTLVYGYRLLKEPKTSDFIKFGGTSIFALYTHYYCAFWLMFLYMGVLFYIIKDKKFNTNGIPFLITAFVVALLFAPWLIVPLQRGGEISQHWYVSKDFVNHSWLFFINPLTPDIFQSEFVWTTIFSATCFTFILICGVFDKEKTRPFILTIGIFLCTYALLFLLSYTVRPMLTSRYLKIYSVLLYFAGAFVLAHHNFLQKGFIIVAVFGFIFTWMDIYTISFDMGYQNVVRDIKRYVTKDSPMLVFDNSNLFCEYYLPEYRCLLIITDNNGEILRKPYVHKNWKIYPYNVPDSSFAISIFAPVNPDQNCQIYTSDYRYGQNVKLCKFTKDKTNQMLETSRYVIKLN